MAKLRCDNGAQYASNDLKSWCKQRGTVLDYTVPYSPQSNGKSERLNRTLLDKARVLIFDFDVGKEMWGEAIRVAAYLTNRSPTETVTVTPFEMWNNRQPDLKYIQLFGTEVYAKNLGYLRKLDERSKRYTFIGYGANGYRLFDSNEQN